MPITQRYGVNAIAKFPQVTNTHLTNLAKLADEDAIKVYVGRIFSLDHAREALSYLQTGHPRGKVVLEIK